MKYGKIEGVEKDVSKIIFGLAGDLFWKERGSDELLDAVIAAGINTFDTARVYGKSERNFGNWLQKKGNRDQVVILSKCGHPSLITGKKRVNEKEMYKDLKKSLEELQTDYIDIYLLHRDDPEQKAGDLVEIFNAMHADGKIGAFGGSNWTCRRIEEANEYAYQHNLLPFTVSSPNFGLAEMVQDIYGGCVSISGQAGLSSAKWYQENQMPVVAFASLGMGMMSGKLKSAEKDHAKAILGSLAVRGYGSEKNYERLRRCEELAEEKGCTVSQIALAWVIQQEIPAFAVVSASGIPRAIENAKAAEVVLNEQEIRYLEMLSPQMGETIWTK